MISTETMEKLYAFQQNEITEAEIYRKIASNVKSEKERETLLRISAEEDRHGKVWGSYTGKTFTPDKRKVRQFTWIAKIFGYTFAIKKMENGEGSAQINYAEKKFAEEVPEAEKIVKDEAAHETALIDILDEERLRYIGSIVLGLNDALVEISGSLAGFTLAYRNTRMTALAGLITGIAATFSMAASEFLSARADGNEDAKKSCLYTGAAYLITVALLVLPYLLLNETAYIPAMVIMLVTVLLIIAFFSYYISVAKNISFKSRFFEMAGISIGVAALSFVIGLLVKQLLGIDI